MSKYEWCGSNGSVYKDGVMLDASKECNALQVHIAKLESELAKVPWRRVPDTDKDYQCSECKNYCSRGKYPTHFGHTNDCSYSAYPIIERAEKAEALVTDYRNDMNRLTEAYLAEIDRYKRIERVLEEHLGMSTLKINVLQQQLDRLFALDI
jgi:hypothetical protein